jgi:hypothetical protein|uniref:Protein kinase domain-containing protein n=1 Tax=viral metagenome TaxID=1070528 RepID=A0A6C0AM62_9ZZZZ
MEENDKGIDTPTVDMELVSPVRSVTEMEISTPVDKGKGVILYELGYLLEKLEKENNKDEMIDLINDMIEILRPLIILYDADTFYLQDDVNKYIDILREIFTNHKKMIKYIFKIDKIIPINSANGRIFILKTLSKKYKTSKLLVKVALRETADPISYEYYVGLALNRLRVDYNIDYFAVMYGRFFCGLDPKIDVNEKDVELCDNRYNKKTHLLYEFIRNIETEQVLTLSDYIEELKVGEGLEREINIINVMILVLYGLQEAQDKMDFTHYDLHAKNILVVKLTEEKEYNITYKGEKIKIITGVVPHIIDYGRSHINPETALNENGVFKDYELNVEFSDFELYQNALFKKAVLDRKNVNHLEKIKRVERHLHKLARRYLYKYELLEGEETIETYETLEFKKGILEMYYNGQYEIVNNEFKVIKCDFGIDTRLCHKKYDFFRICRIVGGMISNISKGKYLYSQNIWKNLGDKLELQYPYHDGWYYSLVSDYKPNPIGIMTDDDSFNEPIDIVKYLYDKLYSEGQSGGMDIKKNRKTIENNKDIMNNVINKTKINFEKIKKKLENEKIKYDFMEIDYSDMNTGSFNMNMDVNKN